MLHNFPTSLFVSKACRVRLDLKLNLVGESICESYMQKPDPNRPFFMDFGTSSNLKNGPKMADLDSFFI